MSTIRLLQSSFLDGICHGFSTRRGGVSTGRHASLNLGRRWGDRPEHVAENLRRLAEDGGFDPDRLTTARQVHGAEVLDVGGEPAGAGELRAADALLAVEPGRPVGIYTADCVPILLADGEGRVCAVHAGWRGTLAGIAANAVEALVAAGARRERIRGALGPSIGPCCFEVGEEVASAFAERVPGAVRRDGRPRPHVDLRDANRTILAVAGVPPERIDSAPPCTRCDADRFFSYRRDGGQIGQMLSFIVAGTTI